MHKPAVNDAPSRTWIDLGEARRLLFDSSPLLAMGLDLQANIVWINPAGQRALGYERGALEGRPLIGNLIQREEIETRASMVASDLGRHVAADANVFSARLRQGLADEHTWLLRTRDGSPLPMRLGLGTLRDGDGGVQGLIAVQQPVDHDGSTLQLSHHDSLTGLPSRAVLQDRAEMAMQRASRAGSQIAFLVIDIDNFDALCEQHGHSVGDDVLRATASRLHFELRKTDSAVRLDRAQFVAMLVDLRNVGEAEQVAAKISVALAAPVSTGSLKLSVGASIGLAMYPGQGDQLLALLDTANQAMLIARARGGNGIVRAGLEQPKRPADPALD
jgi:diguanylate cyclase (GGDEF)-like protein/PAS domain S-box-containing protein